MKKEITQAHLKQLVKYNKDTGIFTRLTPYGKHEIGDVIGKVNNKGYIAIPLRGGLFHAHRLAWLYVTGKQAKGHIDHINQKRKDNRFKNLRDVSVQDNLRNCKVSKRNKLGVTGVSFLDVKTDLPYIARIYAEGRNIILGRFKTLKKATKARKKADKKYGFHKNHGKTNV